MNPIHTHNITVNSESRILELDLLSNEEHIISTGIGEYGHGLNIYDLKGNLRFQYNQDMHEDENILIMENYAFLKKDDDHFYFMPRCFDGESSHFIYEFNTKIFTQKRLFNPYSKDFNFLSIDKNNLMFRCFTKNGDSWYALADHFTKIKRKTVVDKTYVFQFNRDYNLIQFYDYSQNNLGPSSGFLGGRLSFGQLEDIEKGENKILISVLSF